jgi:hypothetical protein
VPDSLVSVEVLVLPKSKVGEVDVKVEGSKPAGLFVKSQCCFRP